MKLVLFWVAACLSITVAAGFSRPERPPKGGRYVDHGMRSVLVFAQTLSDSEKTVRDGVYSEEQAKRGKTTYDAKCRDCHDGSDLAPPLKGEEFLAQWEGKTLRRLYSVILSTMPSGEAGSLTEKEVLDLVAYMLLENGFPSGDKELERADDLNTIKVAREAH